MKSNFPTFAFHESKTDSWLNTGSGEEIANFLSMKSQIVAAWGTKTQRVDGHLEYHGDENSGCQGGKSASSTEQLES